MTNNCLGDKIKNLRKRKGISQEQLAEITCLSQQHISRIETGITYPGTLTLNKIAKGLDTPVIEFINDENVKAADDSISQIVEMLELLSIDDKNKVIGYIERLLDESSDVFKK